MPVATKLGRVRIYNEELPSIYSNNHFVTDVVSSRKVLDLLYLYYFKD